MSRVAELFLSFMKRVGARGFWALADQGIVSLGTFSVGILLARNLAPAEYGAFSLIIGMLYLLNLFHNALVSYPLSIKAATLASDGLGSLTGSKIALTAIGSIPLSVGLGVMVYVVGYPQHVVWAIPALLAWQVQETCRRGLMAHMRHRELLPGDSVKSLGWAVSTFVLIQVTQISLGHVLASLAVFSLAAAVIQARQVRARFDLTIPLRTVAVEAWRLGRLVLLGMLLGVLMMQFQGWVLAISHGLEINARLQSLMLILGVLNPVLISVSGLILPAVSTTEAREGFASARKTGYSYGGLGAAVMMPYCLVLVVAPDLVLRLFFGAGSPYLDLSTELRIFVVGYLLAYGSQVLTSVLNGLRRVPASLISQAAGAFSMVLIGVPLIVQWGLMGSMIAGVICYSLMNVVALAYSFFDQGLPWARVVTMEAKSEPEQGPA